MSNAYQEHKNQVNVMAGVKLGDQHLELSKATVRTTSATTTTLLTYSPDNDTVSTIVATITAKQTTLGHRASYMIAGCFVRETTTTIAAASTSTVQQGSTAAVITAIETNGAWDASFIMDGPSILVAVKGAASVTIDWTCSLQATVAKVQA